MTNKGVGGLLKKWGEGASLIRKEWKAREEKGGGGKEERMVDMKSHRDGAASRDDGMVVDDDDDEEEDDEEDDDDDDDDEEEEEPDDLEATPRMLPRRTIGMHSPQSSLSSNPDTHVVNHIDDSTAKNSDLTNLTESLNSLSLVPNSIRFGRGGKSGGFIHRGQGQGGARGGGNRGGKPSRSDRGGAQVTGSAGADVMEVDVVPIGTGALGRGRAGVIQVRGRGRGRARANGRGRGRAGT